MVHSIAAGLSEMAEAVRAADAASAARSAQASGEGLFIPASQSFAGPTGEPELPKSSAGALPTGGLFEDVAVPGAQREQSRALCELPTTQNRSDETPADQHLSQAAWGD
jgi:hypothetical protein